MGGLRTSSGSGRRHRDGKAVVLLILKERRNTCSQDTYLSPIPDSFLQLWILRGGGKVRVPNLNSHPILMSSALFPLLKMERKPKSAVSPLLQGMPLTSGRGQMLGMASGLGGEAEGGVVSPMMYSPDAVHND